MVRTVSCHMTFMISFSFPGASYLNTKEKESTDGVNSCKTCDEHGFHFKTKKEDELMEEMILHIPAMSFIAMVYIKMYKVCGIWIKESIYLSR